MTYSIVAIDADAEEIGVILQSYYYGCGPRTIAAEPGIGIVVMQMIPDASYAREGLNAMKEQRPPDAILSAILAGDDGRNVRQVAMLDVSGRVAAYTGSGCIPVSGHRIGIGISAQGAMVESDDVWESAMEAFDKNAGRLAERLLAASRAGERAGGDIRGQRAAALVVVSTHNHPSWVVSRPINIRVDDDTHPLDEVERHLAIQRHMNAVELAFERGLGGDVSGAVGEYRGIAEHFPDDPDVTMRYAIMLAMSGEIQSARSQLERMETVHPGWKKVTRRLIDSGLLPNDPALLPRTA